MTDPQAFAARLSEAQIIYATAIIIRGGGGQDHLVLTMGPDAVETQASAKGKIAMGQTLVAELSASYPRSILGEIDEG